jgi:hypothetical protein
MENAVEVSRQVEAMDTYKKVNQFRGVLLAILLTGIPITGTFAQNAVAARIGYQGSPQLAAYGELGLSNVVSLYLMPSIFVAVDDFDQINLAAGARFYPLDFGDLGSLGYPRDRRDFLHQWSPFLSVGAQYSILTPDVDSPFDYHIDDSAEQVIFLPVEIGARWYVFRTFVLSRNLLLDNAFVEVPIGYSLNVSSTFDVADYNDALDDEFSEFYFGLAAGLSF